jgi:inosose dehydratase
VAQFQAAGITPLSCGNVTMRNDPADVRRAFEYARDAGIPTIVCAPDPSSMSLLDEMVKEFDIRLAIHNHGPEDDHFPSPYAVRDAVEGYDSRIGLCIDVGHTARAGVDPAEAIRRCHERLHDVHLKDLDTTAREGRSVEMGRGVLDVGAILEALLRIGYPHLVSFEYEKDPEDPLPGLAESVGYVKGVLRGLA